MNRNVATSLPNRRRRDGRWTTVDEQGPVMRVIGAILRVLGGLLTLW